MTEANDTTILVDQGYKLTPVMSGQKRKLCFVCGRQGSSITLLLVNEIVTANVQHFDREYARVQTKDGYYNLMPCNRVIDLQEVAAVCDIIKNYPEEL